MERLLRIRMSVATNLLTETDLPVKAIARAVGYSTHNYFCSSYRRYHGLTPTQYRIRHRAHETGARGNDAPTG